jgi:hypothetical protein
MSETMIDLLWDVFFGVSVSELTKLELLRFIVGELTHFVRIFTGPHHGSAKSMIPESTSRKSSSSYLTEASTFK